MGADRGILVKTDAPSSRWPSPRCSRRRRQGEARPRHPRQAGDRRRRNQTGQMLAALLGWPQGTFASKVEIGTAAT
jgi:electron transfer flavoprotein beta subunit